MSRVTEPTCRHARKGIVTAGGPGRAHAATNVCDRQACIDDATFWARAITGETPEFIPDRSPVPPEPNLFDVSTWG